MAIGTYILIITLNVNGSKKVKVKVKLLSHVCLFATQWTIAYQAPPSTRFSRQEYWSGLPFSSPGDLSKPGMECGSPAFQTDTLPSEPPGVSKWIKCSNQKTQSGWMDTKTGPILCCLQETHFRPQDTYRLKVRGWKNIFHANGIKESCSSNTHIRQNRP